MLTDRLVQLAVRPVQSISVDARFGLVVDVDHHIHTFPILAPLRTFFMTLAKTRLRLVTDRDAYKRLEGCCIPEPLGFYALLGFRVGDRAVVDNDTLFIEFFPSSTS